jgi:hypothetical protein
MSFPTSALHSLQQAGQGIHTAGVAITEAVNASALKMASSITSDPFSPDGEAAFTKVRSMARIGHELSAMEEKLRELFDQAQKLTGPEAPMVLALEPAAKTGPGKRSANPAAKAEDVVDKMAEKPAAKPESTKKQKPLKMSPNDSKLLEGLKKNLSRKSWKSMTHGVMAHAAGIPSGSVGLSLKRLVQMGKLVMNADGAYRLG